MKLIKIFQISWWKRLIKTSALAVLLLALSLPLSGAWWNFGNDNTPPPRQSGLAKGNAITDPKAILRYALPIDNETVRQLQGDLEDISEQIRRKRWSQISRDVRGASIILSIKSDQLLESVPDERKTEAEALIEQIDSSINALSETVETKDKEQILSQQEAVLDQVTDLEKLMVQGFPFTVPDQYANLPQLLGRAVVDVETTKGNLTVVVDGYSAPVNGGNFVDLVQRGFYDGLNFSRSQDDFVLQTGDPPGREQGFIDPETGKYRAIPLEVLVAGDKEPIYGITLEDAGKYLEQPVIPFNAYGAVALARPSTDPNGGSSQFFFFKFDTELTPPGFNLMDGRYSVFGYLVKGKEVMAQLTKEDKIISTTVVEGSENLVQPQTR